MTAVFPIFPLCKPLYLYQHMTDHLERLLLATNNAGKLAELARLIDGTGIELVGLDSFPAVPEVEETGTTFDENARLKARGYALQTRLYALADDSGLEVRALGGRPGVLSARYGGIGTSFADKMAMLLTELDLTGQDDRTARFVCSIAIARPDGDIIHTVTGRCDGQIASAPRGPGGFGYDPIFIPDGFDQTFGELPVETKQQISHRARAFEQIIPFLRDNTAI